MAQWDAHLQKYYKWIKLKGKRQLSVSRSEELMRSRTGIQVSQFDLLISYGYAKAAKILPRYDQYVGCRKRRRHLSDQNVLIVFYGTFLAISSMRTFGTAITPRRKQKERYLLINYLFIYCT